MEIKELIRILEKLDNNANIYFSSDEEGNNIYELADIQSADCVGLHKKDFCVFPYKFVDETE